MQKQTQVFIKLYLGCDIDGQRWTEPVNPFKLSSISY